MLTSNVFRFGTDTFDHSGRQAFLISHEALDCTAQTNVDNFKITGSQPTDTDRRVMFLIDNNYYKFKNGSLVKYSGDVDYDDVISDGNTVAELNALSDITAFVGKEIYPVIALKAGWTAPSMPTIKITLNVHNSSATYTKTHNTIIHPFVIDEEGVLPMIVEITPTIYTSGNGTCVVYARLRDADGVWSSYVPYAEVIGQQAEAIRFRIVATVGTIGGDDGGYCNHIVVRYNTGGTAVNSNTADIYSTVQNYDTDLQTCYVVVKHSPITDSKLIAYVNFMSPPKHRELITIGTTTGIKQILPLAVGGVKDTGVDQASIKMYLDGVPYFDFDYNVEVSEVSLTATSGQVVTVSYDYGRDSETWLQMTADDVQPYDDGDQMSRFTYTLPDANAVDKQISNVRLQITRPSGKVKNASLGTATGKTQMTVLPHAADVSTISLNADWNYDEDSQILSYTATKGTALTLNYSWLGEQVYVRSMAAGWVAAV